MEKQMKTAAIYARVSSDKQREENTIASQTAALIEFARTNDYQVPSAWIFEDDGYSGATLVRPGLEREVCLSDPFDRGAGTRRRRDRLPQGTTDGDGRRSVASAIPGDDR